MKDLKKNSESLWQTYTIAFHNSQLAMFQSLLISIISGESLKDFPQKLPQHLRKQYSEGIRAAGKARADLKVGPDGTFEIDFNLYSKHALFSQVAVGIIFEGSLVIAHDPQKSPLTPSLFASLFDCDRTIQAQQLVMLFTQIEAFLAQTIRTICLAKPDVLKRYERKIRPQHVEGTASLDDLMDLLIDQLVFDMSWRGALKQRLESVSKTFGITLDTSRVAPAIQILEKVRNILVHNGGRVSQEFIDRTRIRNVSIGENYPINEMDVLRLFRFAQQLCGSLYIEVSTKFLDKKPSEITGVMHRF
jgi:hypothetical protein